MLKITRKSITYIIALMISSSLCADFKIVGGINLSNYIYSPENENLTWNNKKGPVVGIGIEKSLFRPVILELDIFSLSKGSKNSSSNSPDLQFNYNLNVASLSGLIKTKVLHSTSPYFLGGIELSFLFSHKKIIKGEEEEEIDLSDKTKSFDYGLIFGGGFEIEIKERLYLFIEARYHLGQRNILISETEESMKTKAILIVVGAKS